MLSQPAAPAAVEFEDSVKCLLVHSEKVKVTKDDSTPQKSEGWSISISIFSEEFAWMMDEPLSGIWNSQSPRAFLTTEPQSLRIFHEVNCSQNTHPK